MIDILIAVILSFTCKSGAFLTGNYKPYLFSTTARAAVVDLPKYELVLSSPCKINLFLRILGRRPNGYRKL